MSYTVRAVTEDRITEEGGRATVTELHVLRDGRFLSVADDLDDARAIIARDLPGYRGSEDFEDNFRRVTIAPDGAVTVQG